MDRTVAFLANGVLHLKAPDEPARPLESAFAEEMRGRAHQIHKRHAWKSEGRGAMFMSRGLLWGPPARDAGALEIAMTSLCRGSRPGELLYSMTSEGRTAVCRLRLADGVERRLLHGSENRIQDLCASPRGDEIACSVSHADGSASLAVMTAEATDLRELTEGEVRDGAPVWTGPGGRRLVYESAGVGRDARGRWTGIGPSTLHALDLERGTVEEIATEPKRDLLRPRVGADGTIYCLSRPYRGAERPVAWRLALDLLLLPVRLLHAVFQYLSFFTTKYTGRPLTTAGGPKRQGADVRQMQVWSNLIQAESSEAETEDGGPSAPRSWQLVRREPDGTSAVLAEAVLSFDLGADGCLAYTTGSAIHLVAPDGSRSKVLSQPGITQVVLVD